MLWEPKQRPMTEFSVFSRLEVDFFLSTSVFFHDDVFVSLFIPSSDFSCYFFRFNVISIGFVFLDFI